jgi:hypothetical protein
MFRRRQKRQEKTKGAEMAKAKKKEKKRIKVKRVAILAPEMAPHLSKIRPAVPVARAPEPIRAVSLPELWCRIELPVRVRFLEKMRADTAPQEPGGRKRPAALARIIDHDDADIVKDFALPAALASVFASIPKDGYVGRGYLITRHRRHERKNASGFTVVEIDPTKTGGAATGQAATQGRHGGHSVPS